MRGTEIESQGRGGGKPAVAQRARRWRMGWEGGKVRRDA